jgi:predicted amidohydrolase
MIKNYTVGMIQLNTQDDVEKNLYVISTYITEAAQKGARLVTLPEAMNFIGDRTLPGMPPPEDEEGPTFKLLSGLAKKHGIYIHGGSWAIKKDNDKRAYNTSFLFSPKGIPLAKYRKLHTFDITLPDGTVAR